MSVAVTRLSFREQIRVLIAAFAASAVAIRWSWTHGAFLFYGDAEAHIHIARRLFDSHRPGLAQLGSVWLPLPHLLLAPFVAVDSWWRSGFAPVIPSAACYLLACLGLYRLARKWLSPTASGLAVAFFAINPNLLYLQTTAMTEPLFLCELVWAVLLLVEWHSCLDVQPINSNHQLRYLIAVLVAAVFTRYDGWILAFLAWLAMAICLARRGHLMRSGFILASVVLLAAPVTWMIYNAAVFGDWLDFARGPYSAKVIEEKTSGATWPPHPGWHNPWVSAIFFTKAAEMDAAVEPWGGALLAFAAIGSLGAWIRRKPFSPASGLPAAGPSFADHPNANQAEQAQPQPAILWPLLLWLPLPFYAYSVSYGSVPIFLPVWFPHSWYNTRYGMELLPAFAFGLGCLADQILSLCGPARSKWRWAAATAMLILLVANSAEMLLEGPLTYSEAVKNTLARGFYNRAIAASLRHLHDLSPSAVVLMDTSPYPSIVPRAGLTYHQTLNESDKQFYKAALEDPAAHAAIVLAFAGDEVDQAVKAHPAHLIAYQSFAAKNQPDATLYLSDTFPGMSFQSDTDREPQTRSPQP